MRYLRSGRITRNKLLGGLHERYSSESRLQGCCYGGADYGALAVVEDYTVPAVGEILRHLHWLPAAVELAQFKLISD